MSSQIGSCAVVAEVLQRKLAIHSRKKVVNWALGGLILIVSTMVFVLSSGGCGPEYNSLRWWMWICTWSFGGIIVIHLIVSQTYTYMMLRNPLEVTDNQRKLMNIGATDCGFKNATPKETTSSLAIDKNLSLSALFGATVRPMSPPSTSPNSSWMDLSATSPAFSPALSMSSNSSGSVTANSWAYHRSSSNLDTSYNIMTSPICGVFSTSQMSESSNKTSSPISSSPCHNISDRAELEEFLSSYREKEKLKHMLSQNESNNSFNNSRWSYGASPRAESGQIHRRNLYQVATKTPVEADNEDLKNPNPKAATLSTSAVSKIWRKRNVTPEQLFQFTENLRIWMSSNLLAPLIKDIDATNKLLNSAAPEIQIGSVAIDKLKKTAQNIAGVKQLNDLIPFLDCTVHQDYLVKRLRELGAGGAVSAYRWNSGGNHNGQLWKEDYPTDTAILLHLFGMSLDAWLPPDISRPNGRNFSAMHIVKTPENPPKPTLHPVLHVMQTNPPHIKVILPPDEECEVGNGRNNFIHAVLLFIHHISENQHSQIGGINLTMSGINLTWVVRNKA